MNIFVCIYIYIYMLTLDTELVQITYAMQNFLTKIVIGVYTVFKFYHIFYVPCEWHRGNFITYFRCLVSDKEDQLIGSPFS